MRQSWQCCFLQEVATMTHQHRVNMGQLSRVGAHRGITEGICGDLRHLAIGIPDSSANREHVTRNLQAVFIDQDTFTLTKGKFGNQKKMSSNSVLEVLELRKSIIW